jgi:hypothetical protein
MSLFARVGSSKAQTIQDFLFRQNFVNECLSNNDTVYRPVLISNDLQIILGLHDTILVRNVTIGNVKKNKIYIYKFCQDKNEIAKKISINEKRKYEIDSLILIATFYVQSNNDDGIIINYLDSCVEPKTIVNRKKAIGFTTSSKVKIKFKGNKIEIIK